MNDLGAIMVVPTPEKEPNPTLRKAADLDAFARKFIFN
jgi:hypothetical protein